MIIYLALPTDVTYGLNQYTEYIVHNFYSTDKMYIMFDVRDLSTGLDFLYANEITQEQYWQAYGENKPILEWNASPFLENGKVQYRISIREQYLFEILKATGTITKDHYKLYTGKDADGLILQTTEPSIICLEDNAILTKKEYHILTQVLQDMKLDILMAYDYVLKEIHQVSRLENHFVL